MKRVFVTGTDTGVGKTQIATAPLAAWSRQGCRVAAMKPVETGCAVVDGRRVAEDAERLLAATGRALDPALVCPYRFATPASPRTAALLDGEPAPDAAAIVRAAERLADGADVLLAEGAGGLLVPIAPRLLMADLAERLRMPVLIVARTALGTINHTLLSIEAAHRRGLRVVGVVLNQQDVAVSGHG